MRRASIITLTTGGTLLGVAWGLGELGLLLRNAAVLRMLPIIIAGLLAVLAWRYRRDRLAVAAALIVGVSRLSGTSQLEITGATILLTLWLSADLCVLACTADRPLGRLTSLAWLFALTGQLWTVTMGISVVAPLIPPMMNHPPVITAIAVTSVAATLAAFVLRRGATEAGLFWATVAGAAGLAWPRDAHTTNLLVVAIALTLLVGVVEESYRLAYHDELTGLPGRRALNDHLDDLRGSFAIAMVDIDHFKRFNDRHGHDAGDQVLRMVADELGRVGGRGRAFRYGGEEFTVLFPGQTAAEARPDVDELRRSIADRTFALRGPDRPRERPDALRRRPAKTKRVTVTVSIGLAGAEARRTTAEAVMRAADNALYRAKKAGRNKVVAAGERLKR